MFLRLPAARPASLEFGITVRAWSLISAADAFAAAKEALVAIDLIALRCRRGTLRVHVPRANLQSNKSADSEAFNPFKIGIAGIPLELILSFRETIIDLALWSAEKGHINCVAAVHEEYHAHTSEDHDYVPFSRCLQHAKVGDLDTLCEACADCAEPRIDHKALTCLLAQYSLALVSSTGTPFLTSPPYSPIEPYPWAVALATHHIPSTSRAPNALPMHTPSQQGRFTPATEISFFAPTFMRITGADIARFRNLVRTWRLTVVELSGPVVARRSESTTGGHTRSSSLTSSGVPGAILDMKAIDLMQSGLCEPKWMLLNPNRHAGRDT